MFSNKERDEMSQQTRDKQKIMEREINEKETNAQRAKEQQAAEQQRIIMQEKAKQQRNEIIMRQNDELRKQYQQKYTDGTNEIKKQM